MNPGIQLAAVDASLSQFQRLLCLLFVFVLVGGFVASVSPVVAANPDDRDFVAAAQDAGIAQQLLNADLRLGRFYAPVKFAILKAGYAHPNASWVSAWRAALLITEALLVGALIAVVAENEAAGWLTAVLVAAFLQFVPTYTPVVSYPQLGVGMSLYLGSLLAWHRGCRPSSAGWRVLAVALFAGSLLTHEFFLSLLPVHLTMGAHASRWRSVRYAWSLFVIGAVYTVGYAATAHAGRGDAYEGTQPHFAAAEAATALFRQTLSAAPGIEGAIDRSSPDALRSGPSAWRLVEHDLRWSDIVTAIALVPVVVLLSARVRPARRALLVAAVTIGLACLPSVMIALTGKYQVWSRHRIFPYTYAYYSAYFFIGAVVLGLQAARARCGRPAAARAIGAAFAVAVGCVALICRMTSREAVEQVELRGIGFLHEFPSGTPTAHHSSAQSGSVPRRHH